MLLLINYSGSKVNSNKFDHQLKPNWCGYLKQFKPCGELLKTILCCYLVKINHAIVHFKSPVVTSLGRTASFDVALASAALLGGFGEAASPSVKFLPALWSGWHLPFVVYFYKVHLNTLDICFCWLLSRVRSGHSLEGSALILRVL